MPSHKNHLKRFLVIVMALLLLLSATPLASTAAIRPPDGFTPIYTALDLSVIRDNPDGSYILMNDLDLTGQSWTPITQFTGVFNSNYYAIEGLTASLFIEARNCEIKNLRLINCDISSETSNVGAVAGFASNAIISDCTVTGAVRGASANAQVGGIVGSASLSQIRVCKNEAKYSPMDDNKME